MARWHKPSCTTPLVIIDHTSKTPHCTSCGSSPNIEELVAAVAGFSPLPPVPPDEPLDNLNLFWPPTVKYTYPDTHQPKIDPDELNTSPPTSTSCITINNTCGRPSKRAKTEPVDPDELNITSPPRSTSCITNNNTCDRPSKRVKTEPVDPSTIPAYRRALKPDEFRLLRLPYGGPEDPIHITLEICHDDDYPNYETCSYSWGGEEGDSTLCKPVFVGEYWDILFQTRNCWDMLRCLRPSTKNSQRVLWVDAICINQRDTYGEREEQIEKMFQLYRKADRVVVFLGADMFGDLGGRTYPKRRELSEIPRFKTGDDGQICLVDMLNRRYFERLWVVQELLISQIAVIRVRDTEYWITNTTADKFYDSDHDWDWEAMPAPWLGQAAKGAFTGQQTSGFSSLLRLMKVTSNCLGADPRDKVFGILALAQANAEHGDLIRPDYSLSLQHIMVGTLAHCLVVDKYDDFLWEACGVQGWDEYPSWAPAWRSPNFLHKERMVSRYDASRADDRFDEWQSGGSFDLKEWARCCGLGPEPYAESLASQEELDGTDDWSPHGTPKLPVYLRITRDWRHESHKNIPLICKFTAVSGFTGALSIRLMHLCRLSSQPAAIARLESTILYSVDDILLLLSEAENLEHLIEPDSDHLFALEREDQDPIFFILRSIDYELWNFKVVAVCYQAFVRPLARKGLLDNWFGTVNTFYLAGFRRSLSGVMDQWTEPWTVVGGYRKYNMQSIMSKSWWKLRHIFMIPLDSRGRKWFPQDQLGTTAVISSALYARDGSDGNLMEAYVQIMERRYGQGSVNIYDDNGVQFVEVLTRPILQGMLEEFFVMYFPWIQSFLLSKDRAGPCLDEEDFVWTEARPVVEPSDDTDLDYRQEFDTFGQPDGCWVGEGDARVWRTSEQKSISRPWVGVSTLEGYQDWRDIETWTPSHSFANDSKVRLAVRGRKDHLLRALREALQDVNVFGGRLNGKDGSCWRAWRQGPNTEDAPPSMKLGPVHAEDLAWPNIGLGGWGRGKVADGGLVFDGMTYTVEIL